jgi:hypothetical protein
VPGDRHHGVVVNPTGNHAALGRVSQRVQGHIPAGDAGALASMGGTTERAITFLDRFNV